MATYTNKNGTNEADTLTYNKAGSYYAYSGKDTITINGGSGVIVHAGAGNNVVKVTGGSGHTVKSAYTEAEGEKIISADTLTIDGADIVEAILGSGKDVIILNTSNGRKSDGSLAKIKGGAWGDTFTTDSGAQKYQLYGEAGNDVFNVNGGSNLVLWGGAADDIFNLNGGTNIKAYGGDSADTFNINMPYQNVILGYGNDTVNVNYGDKQQIKCNLGINTINLKEGSGHTITADIDQAASKKAGKEVGYGVDKVYITGTANNVTANLGDGKDIVEVSTGSYHSIYTEGWGDTLTISGTTRLSTFDAGDGDDTFTLQDSVYANTLIGGNGNDTFNINGGTSTTIRADAGNDTINIKGGTSTIISADAGNDTINLEAGKVIEATTGSGEDTVTVNGGTLEKVTSTEGGLSLSVGTNGRVDRAIITGGSATINAEASTTGFTQLSFSEAGTQLVAYLGSATDSVYVNSGAANYVEAGGGNDTISCRNITNSAIYGGTGDDTLTLYGSATTTDFNRIYGNEGKDKITITGGSNNTIFGGEDNDTITFKHDTANNIYGKNNTAHGGSGNDIITLVGDGSYVHGGTGSDTLYISEATKATLYGGDDADIIYINANTTSSSIYGDAGDDTITMSSNGSNNKIYGGSGADEITYTGTGNADTKSYNTFYGDEGKDIIKISKSNYNTIYGGTHADTITITYGTNNKVLGGSGADTINLYSSVSSSEVHGETDNDTINVSNAGSNILISGGAGDDKVSFTNLYGTGKTKNSYIYGGSGKDSIDLGYLVNNSTVLGGLGNDVITAGGSASITQSGNKLVGGAGSDTYSIYLPNNTIYIDAATNQGSEDKDILEVYVGSSFTLKTYNDYDNHLKYLVDANNPDNGGILVKSDNWTRIEFQYYNIADFRAEEKTDITSTITGNGSHSQKSLSDMLTQFGAENYDSIDLTSFINDDSDLKISGNS